MSATEVRVRDANSVVIDGRIYKVSMQMRRMLINLRDHDDPLWGVHGRSAAGGADGTQRALVTRGLARYVPSKGLQITAAGLKLIEKLIEGL